MEPRWTVLRVEARRKTDAAYAAWQASRGGPHEAQASGLWLDAIDFEKEVCHAYAMREPLTLRIVLRDYPIGSMPNQGSPIMGFGVK